VLKATTYRRLEAEMDTTAWEMLQGPLLAAAGLESLTTDLTARRQVEAEPAKRVRFETLFADLSAVNPSGPDDAVPTYIQAGATPRLQQELVHVTRVAMLGELAATLAHELSRPLAAILSNAQAAHRFLTMASPQLDEVQEGLEDVIAQTRRAAELLQRLRALAKKSDLKRITFDMNEMIREVIHLVGGEAKARQASITLHLQDDLPHLSGDRIQLQQVVLNFVLNAFDAIAAASDRPREIVVRTRLEPPQGITVAVEDSGIGLKGEALRHMFDPFFSTKAEGLGMGLAISRSIILTHRGRIWATPHPGRGTTVSFSIPTGGKETA
jgi:two-component system, LuxR family, sensor kinase FixL